MSQLYPQRNPRTNNTGFTREELRDMARAKGIPRGRNTIDTLNNLKEAGALPVPDAGTAPTREELRKIAQEKGVPRGRNKSDTLANLQAAGTLSVPGDQVSQRPTGKAPARQPGS